MKKSELRQIIKEEIQKLDEIDTNQMKLLKKISVDWGKDIDLYYAIEDALVAQADKNTIKRVLDNYDVYNDYKRYLKYF